VQNAAVHSPQIPPSLDGAIAYLSALVRERFWGAVTLKFEGGQLVHVRREENLKPSELSGSQRFVNELSSNS
jgi:hypothetical protein